MARKAKMCAQSVVNAPRILIGDTHTSGNSGITSLRKPYAPSLSITPASSIEPAVGASECASGNHVWKGHTGILMQKATKKPRNANPFTVSTEIPRNVPPCVVSAGHKALIT
jgi:hypothetical protein